jgi:hypothetical protein
VRLSSLHMLRRCSAERAPGMAFAPRASEGQG